MGLSLSPAPTGQAAPGRSVWQRLVRVCALVRYRFFLYAGLLPYLLGAAWAYALADAFDFEGDRIPVTISVGVSTTEVEIAPEAFIKMCDDNLYKAKRGGRNRVIGQ